LDALNTIRCTEAGLVHVVAVRLALGADAGDPAGHAASAVSVTVANPALILCILSGSVVERAQATTRRAGSFEECPHFDDFSRIHQRNDGVVGIPSGSFAHCAGARYEAPVQIAGVEGHDAAVAGGAIVGTGVGIAGATQSSQAGPIVAGVVAVIVALITWYATDKRQAKAIVAERERFQQQLDAEAERHRERLAHERDIANLEELRTALDDALKALAACERALREWESAASAYVEAATKHGVPGDLKADRLHDARREFTASVTNVIPHRQVLQVRLGRSHALVEAFSRAVLLLSPDKIPRIGQRPTEEAIASVNDLRRSFRDDLGEVIDLMHQQVTRAR
jgi:hypothetical protein